MKQNDNFVLFYGGPFSQWFMRPFQVDGVEYNCAEQYMMAGKARLFKDDAMLAKIMASRDPYAQKMEYGRYVRNFDVDVWNSNAREIVYQGNVAKFGQNKDIKATLLKTGTKTIVEASPYDKIWGIGLGVDNPLALIPEKWRGTNWLGEVLMRVRDTLKE